MNFLYKATDDTKKQIVKREKLFFSIKKQRYLCNILQPKNIIIMKKILLLFAVLFMSANGFAQNNDNDGKYDYYCVLSVSFQNVYIDCLWARKANGEFGEIDFGKEKVSVGNTMTFMAKHGWELVCLLTADHPQKPSFLMKKRVANEEEAKKRNRFKRQ